MITSLLIANRGEIALRVIRTARAMGIECVAVHTKTDADALHVRAADRAVEIDSYLDIDAVVAAARGVDAVHPGYGFLSERAEFARALETAGIILVGPTSEVMDQMGRKDRAREVAVAAGVPVVPSYSLDDDPTTFAYPVLVKAAAGGGGKGMRVVSDPSEYAEAAAAAAREAAHAFGDDTLLVEKYVESGRHIEVQVLADAHGNVRHFFERDCSTQRRHQKVLEEATAPTMSEAQRHAIHRAAVDLAAEVGYTNAGTVEFLLDNATGEFYFLEMNTRLQVEHPVTEMVSRIRGGDVDLVALQLAVANGERLHFDQDEVTCVGHAIEARVYAEDAFGGFLPQAGRAGTVRWPSGTRVRVEAALESGQVVATDFDPMLGKVIVWGEDRESARRGLVAALDDTVITGLTTNTGFLRALVAGDDFRDATIDTAWLDHHEVPVPDGDLARRLAARALAPDPGQPSPFRPDGWRLGAAPVPALVRLDRVVRVENVADGRPNPATVERHGRRIEAVLHGHRHVFTVPDPFASSESASGDGTVVSPMPGAVIDVRVAVGDEVAAGDVLGVMEAMKMEHSLKAPYAGTVTRVGAARGDQVSLGAVLFEVSADE